MYYWLSDTWNDEKETIFFFPGLTADHTLFESQVENMICVGQSFGGYHIQVLIARYPEKVKAFWGIGTSPYGENIIQNWIYFGLNR